MTFMAVASAMKSAISVGPGISMEPAIPVESVITAPEPMVPAIEPAVAMELGAAMEIRASIETADSAIIAAEPGAPVKILAATEIAVIVSAEGLMAAEVAPAIVFAAPTFVSAKIAPVPAAPVAPVVAIVVIAPAIAVEIDPGRIVKIEIAPPVESRAVESVEPWPRPDEHAAYEPFRPVIAVGSAGVRVIGIIPIGADGRGIHRRPYANPDTHTDLRVSPFRRYTRQCNCQSNDCGIL